MLPTTLVSPETRSAPCAVCGARHSNTALCDACADKVATPCPWDGIEGCDCLSCSTAARACGALALVESDLNVYALPEVRDARAELAAAVSSEELSAQDLAEIDALASAPVEGEALPWERAYEALPSLVETANASAWRRFGAPRVRLETSDGATWKVTAIDADGAMVTSAPTCVDATPEDAVFGWTCLVDAMPVAAARGDRPLTLAEAFPAGMTFSLEDCDAPFVDLATGREVVIVDAADRAEVA